MEPVQPICRTQSFLEPRFSLVKNKQLQLGHLAGCIYPGEALIKGSISVFGNRLWSRTAVRFADFRISGFPHLQDLRVTSHLAVYSLLNGRFICGCEIQTFYSAAKCA